MAMAGVPATGGPLFVRSAAFDSAPHPAPQEQWVVMLRGTIEVEVSEGTKRRFGPGDLVLATDTTGAGHITVGVGDPPFEALFLPALPGSAA
jgi:quercetin dioxygenase-like cupin family protein